MSTMRTVEIVINDGEPEAGEFSIEVEQIDVSGSWRWDPTWEFIDARGHFHAYAKDGKTPTLMTKLVPATGYDDEDEPYDYEASVLACRACGEVINPGMVSSAGWREFAPGLMTWTVIVNRMVEGTDSVSLRVTSGEQLFFGIARLVGHRWDGGRRFTEFVGDSPLGERKARRPAEV